MAHNTQIDNIQKLRAANYSYTQIARTLEMSVNTVKSVCRRYGFTVEETCSDNVSMKTRQEELLICRYCGQLMDNLWHRSKSFCSDKCRYDYWNREKRLTHYIPPKRRKDLSKKALDLSP